jgi:predicted DNA-binding protein
MGRPPLNLKETKVRLADDRRERIEALVGSRRMAEFIRVAIDNELERREMLLRKKRPKAKPSSP